MSEAHGKIFNSEPVIDIKEELDKQGVVYINLPSPDSVSNEEIGKFMIDTIKECMGDNGYVKCEDSFGRFSKRVTVGNINNVVAMAKKPSSKLKKLLKFE